MKRQIFGIMTETLSIYLTKKIIWFFTSLTAINLLLFILQLPSCSAVLINEIELNPTDSDAGKEWIELYSPDKISLKDYYLENEDGDIHNLNGSIEGHLAINFEKQWLDNTNTIVYLKINNETIFHTPELSDSENNDLTLNLCNNSFILIESSKNGENHCPLEKNEDKVTNLSINNDKIFLNKENSELILSKDAKIRLYISYFFTIFTIIIVILIYLRKL